MKMIRRTSKTSIRGVTLMKGVGRFSVSVFVRMTVLPSVQNFYRASAKGDAPRAKRRSVSPYLFALCAIQSNPHLRQARTRKVPDSDQTHFLLIHAYFFFFLVAAAFSSW